jgi:hypothetical protein
MIKTLTTLYDWLVVRDYEMAKEEAARRVVSRFARGNVLLQSGHYLTEAEVMDVSRRGDRAMDRLNRAAGDS